MSMKVLDDKIASAGEPLDDNDMVPYSYILAGFNFDYLSFVSAICGCTEPIKSETLPASMANNLILEVSNYGMAQQAA
ncbi:hypothetical protein D1007_12098 [Hordeum vulgare]|nr:hypothetical protein D1007_12098 [Hordeum vulgare]